MIFKKILQSSLLTAAALFSACCASDKSTTSADNVADSASLPTLPDQSSVEPVPNAVEQTQTIQPESTWSPKESAAVLGQAMKASALLHIAQQPMVTAPSSEAVLYLMRAARYREAADYAARAPQTTAMRFVRAKAHVQAQLCSEAQPCADMFEALTAPNDDLAPIYAYWNARAYIEDLSFDKALKALSTFAHTYDAPSQMRSLLLDFCKHADKRGIFDEQNALPTSKQFNELASLISRHTSGANAFEAASLTYYEMRIAASLGNNKLANQKKFVLIQRYPATQMALWPELVGSVEQLAHILSPNERYARCERLISHFDYDNARKELKALVDSPQTPSATRDKAEWELARVSMTNSEEPGLSEKIYRKWAKKPGKLQEEAVFGIARALSRQLKYPEAIKALEAYDAKYPRGKYNARSLYLRGWYLFDLRRNAEARPLLLAYAEKTNDTSVWGFYAQTFIRDGMWREAIDAFEHLKRAGNPIVRGKAMYWQAYADHQLGNDESARRRLRDLHAAYPLTWYDMLAYEREQDWFGSDEEAAFEAAFRFKSDPRRDNVFYAWGWGSPVQSFPSSSLWSRITTLAEHDAIDEARILYNKNETALLNAVPASERDNFRRYATHLVESYNASWEATSGSVRALSDVWPERDNLRHKMAYPQPFAPLVESLAMQYGLPHHFIYGIMLQESRFRPWQVSSADAIGALQMIPKTARPIARELGVEYHPDTFFDPRVGFPYSAYYMKSHYERWGHNLTFTAGSYNGGPHRIGPWAIRDKGKTIDFIVDEFSFDESRHYARKVAEHTLRFAYLYARSTKEWLDIVHQIVPRVVPDIAETDDWGL